MKKQSGIIVTDPLKGISSIYKMYESDKVVIYYFDLSASLKRCEPDDVIADRSHFEIKWLDPQWKIGEKARMTSVKLPNPFTGDYSECDYLTQTSRYSCWIVLFQKDLLRNSAKAGPVWWRGLKK